MQAVWRKCNSSSRFKIGRDPARGDIGACKYGLKSSHPPHCSCQKYLYLVIKRPAVSSRASSKTLFFLGPLLYGSNNPSDFV